MLGYISTVPPMIGISRISFSPMDLVPYLPERSEKIVWARGMHGFRQMESSFDAVAASYGEHGKRGIQMTYMSDIWSKRAAVSV